MPTQTKTDFSWRRENLLALIVLCTLAGGGLGWSLLAPSTRLTDRVPVEWPKVQLAQQKVDPNTASAASLRRLHGLGPARVAAIIRYRSAATMPAFRGVKDLEKVYGLGPTTAQRVGEYMSFDGR